MHSTFVKVYRSGSDRELLAIIPVAGGHHVRTEGRPETDDDIIAAAMGSLGEQKRFSTAEIRAFHYRVERAAQTSLEDQGVPAPADTPKMPLPRSPR